MNEFSEPREGDVFGQAEVDYTNFTDAQLHLQLVSGLGQKDENTPDLFVDCTPDVVQLLYILEKTKLDKEVSGSLLCDVSESTIKNPRRYMSYPKPSLTALDWVNVVGDGIYRDKVFYSDLWLIFDELTESFQLGDKSQGRNSVTYSQLDRAYKLGIIGLQINAAKLNFDVIRELGRRQSECAGNN